MCPFASPFFFAVVHLSNDAFHAPLLAFKCTKTQKSLLLLHLLILHFGGFCLQLLIKNTSQWQIFITQKRVIRNYGQRAGRYLEIFIATVYVVTMQSKSLPEEAVPGASLSGRKPEDLKVPELKTWLTCRGLPTKGKKADLSAR